MAKKKIAVKSENVFSCDSCKDCKEMEVEEFKKHLLDVHGITNEQIKGKKQMISHMDATEWFSSVYKWTLESGLSFHQSTIHPRSKHDMMRY